MYCFSLSDQGELVEAIPEGYEVYESPRGQVFLRRVRPQLITPDEIATVEQEVRRYPWLRQARIDVKDRMIIVYVLSADSLDLSKWIRSMTGERGVDIPETTSKHLQYSADMRFVLVYDDRCIFRVQRYCYRGSVDDWIYIGEPGSLQDLAREFVRHLGQDSFFDLERSW